MSKKTGLSLTFLVGIAIVAGLWLLGEDAPSSDRPDTSKSGNRQVKSAETSRPDRRFLPPRPVAQSGADPAPPRNVAARHSVVIDDEERAALGRELRTIAHELKAMESGFLEGSTSEERFENYYALQSRYYETARQLRPSRVADEKTIQRQEEFERIAEDWDGTAEELAHFKIKFMKNYPNQKKGVANEE